MRQQTAAALLVFGLCLGFCSQFPPRRYFYVNQLLTWTKAQQYCREHHTDLARFENMDDINMLETDISYSLAWIGLWDDPENWKTKMGNGPNSWKWSATGETSKTGYQSWSPINPDYYLGKETCGILFDSGKWGDWQCPASESFICYNVTEQNVKQFFYISTKKSWSSAQTYCRENYVDLAMIENQKENDEVIRLVPKGVYSWIGLYREPWIWSDGSRSLFRHWTSLGPTNSGGGWHCGAENNLHEWKDENCTTSHVFICYQEVTKAHLVKMEVVTDADLTDPDISARLLQQLGAKLASQGWTDAKVRWQNTPQKEGQ